jgi:hypothetical protein
MTFKKILALGAGLALSSICSAQQNSQAQPQPQTPQKIEAPCEPKQLAEIQKREQTRARRLLGGLLNRVNKEAQQKTGGAAPVVTPDDLAKQVQTPCKAPAVVTPPPNGKQ